MAIGNPNEALANVHAKLAQYEKGTSTKQFVRELESALINSDSIISCGRMEDALSDDYIVMAELNDSSLFELRVTKL